MKKGLRGRADIVVYRDDKQEEALMVIECKAPYIDVDCNIVLDQAVRYRNILGAEYIMLVNGVNAIVYQFKNGKLKEIDKVPSYQELLKSKVKVVKQSKDKPYTFEDIKSKMLQNNFLNMGYIGEDSPKENYEFYLNLLNLLLLKKISSSNILNRIGVIEDCFRGFTFLEIVVAERIKLGRAYLSLRTMKVKIKYWESVYVLQHIQKMIPIGGLALVGLN